MFGCASTDIPRKPRHCQPDGRYQQLHWPLCHSTLSFSRWEWSGWCDLRAEVTPASPCCNPAATPVHCIRAHAVATSAPARPSCKSCCAGLALCMLDLPSHALTHTAGCGSERWKHISLLTTVLPLRVVPPAGALHAPPQLTFNLSQAQHGRTTSKPPLMRLSGQHKPTSASFPCYVTNAGAVLHTPSYSPVMTCPAPLRRLHTDQHCSPLFSGCKWTMLLHSSHSEAVSHAGMKGVSGVRFW